MKNAFDQMIKELQTEFPVIFQMVREMAKQNQAMLKFLIDNHKCDVSLIYCHNCEYKKEKCTLRDQEKKLIEDVTGKPMAEALKDE